LVVEASGYAEIVESDGSPVGFESSTSIEIVS